MDKIQEMASIMQRDYRKMNICTTCIKSKNGSCPYMERIQKANSICEKHLKPKEWVVDELGENPYEGDYGSIMMAYKPIVNCKDYIGCFEDDSHFPRQIVVLSGSTKFYYDFVEEEQRLTLENNIVLSLGVYSKHFSLELTKEQLDDLFYLHIEKILMADRLHVINKGGYIGESTKKEIAFAKSIGIPVTYMEPVE